MARGAHRLNEAMGFNEKESQCRSTVTAPEGVLTPAGEKEILPRLSAALIEASGATGNSFFTPIVGGTVHVLPADRIYAGGYQSSRR